MDDATQEDVRNDSEINEEPTNTEVIEDTDADTRDIEDTNSELFSRMDEFFKRLDNIDARLDALSNAQAIMIENGATIREVNSDSDYEPDNKDEFVPLEELDFTL